jgi:hypothetical protein
MEFYEGNVLKCVFRDLRAISVVMATDISLLSAKLESS